MQGGIPPPLVRYYGGAITKMVVVLQVDGFLKNAGASWATRQAVSRGTACHATELDNACLQGEQTMADATERAQEASS